MRKDYEKLFDHLNSIEPPRGLFDRIILAIKREQELQHTRRLVFGFFILLVISFIATPFSWTLLVEQVESSGVLYFISTAVSDFSVFFTLWKDFSLAVLESLPIAAIAVFTVNMALVLFTLRLFLYRKRLLLAYLIRSY
jgi:hypothetical protein